MSPFRNLATVLVFIAGSVLVAQDCSLPFTAPLFAVHAETDLWYGNAERFNGGTDSLRLDLYKPIGDGQTERPLVVVIHGGGFIGGNRQELTALCTTMASMGWTTATISYRLGFYGNGLVDPPYSYDPDEVRRATYRAMQDAKGAVRFLKGRSSQDSTSTTNVFLMGFSAGAITALHATFQDRTEEKPAAAGPIGPVQHFFNFYPRPDLGPVDGELNQNGQDASVLGVVNYFGAVLDTAFIESPDGPALYSYHQTQDPIVGCGNQRPYWGVGLGIPDNYPYLHGSCIIDERAQQLGFSPERYHFTLHAGNEHTVHDPTGILQETLTWMRALICAPNTSVPTATTSTGLRIYPTPTTGLLTAVSESSGPVPFRVNDALGRSVLRGTIQPGVQQIDLGMLPDGLYRLHLLHGQTYNAHPVLLAR